MAGDIRFNLLRCDLTAMVPVKASQMLVIVMTLAYHV